MYLRDVHTDLNVPTLYDFIRANPLGILTTAISSPNYPLLQSSHIPWVLDEPSEKLSSTSSPDTQPPKAILRGHLARANPQAKALIEAATDSNSSKIKEEILILFNSPINHYITPKFYVETKPSTGKAGLLFAVLFNSFQLNRR